MLAINLSKASAKFLAKLPPKQKKQIAEEIFKLAESPQAPDSSRLHGYDYYRADIGEYRIIYQWSSSILFVTLIGKRNDDDVYRKLRRMKS